MGESKYNDIEGILTILAEEPNWPNPANIYAIPDGKGFSLIDVGCGGDSSIEHLQEGLDHWKLKIEQLHTVVLSHAHPDHMGAMWWILEETNPKIIIHHLDAAASLDPIKLEESFDIPLAKKRWVSSTGEDTFQNFVLLKFFEDSACPMSAADNVEEISEGDSLHLGNFEFEVIHTPGHSPGHISLFERKKGILFPGDLVGKAPAWYVPTAGGVIGYLDSLAKLKTLDAAVLLPAHGPTLEDATRAIRKIQKKLLQRESIIKEALQDGAKSYLELNKRLLGNSHLNFFPGCGIIESHLIKMERQGVIERKGQQVVSLIT
jgi:glyoxylase-like metal-dependent hydrolase (beta-lactamase superfamily II)